MSIKGLPNISSAGEIPLWRMWITLSLSLVNLLLLSAHSTNPSLLQGVMVMSHSPFHFVEFGTSKCASVVHYEIFREPKVSYHRVR